MKKDWRRADGRVPLVQTFQVFASASPSAKLLKGEKDLFPCDERARGGKPGCFVMLRAAKCDSP